MSEGCGHERQRCDGQKRRASLERRAEVDDLRWASVRPGNFEILVVSGDRRGGLVRAADRAEVVGAPNTRVRACALCGDCHARCNIGVGSSFGGTGQDHPLAALVCHTRAGRQTRARSPLPSAGRARAGCRASGAASVSVAGLLQGGAAWNVVMRHRIAGGAGPSDRCGALNLSNSRPTQARGSSTPRLVCFADLRAAGVEVRVVSNIIGAAWTANRSARTTVLWDGAVPSGARNQHVKPSCDVACALAGYIRVLILKTVDRSARRTRAPDICVQCIRTCKRCKAED